MVKNGELVLNKINIGNNHIIVLHKYTVYILINVNIEKIRIYLAPRNFLNNVKEKVKPTEEEISRIKRNKRKFAGQKMRREIMIEAYDDTSEIESRNEFAWNKTNLNLISKR